MQYLNLILRSMTPVQHRIGYFSMHGIAFALAILYIIIHGRKYSMTRVTRGLMIAIVAIMGAMVGILAKVYAVLIGVEFRNLAHTFVLLGPLTYYYSILSRSRPYANLDVMGPMFLIAKGVSGLGCLIWGCCGGACADWGIYSYQRDALIVPMQFFEFAATVLLLCCLWHYEELRGYDGSGLIFGFSFLFYGYIRFITDLFKDNNALFGRTSIDGLIALLMIIAGSFTVYIRRDKLSFS